MSRNKEEIKKFLGEDRFNRILEVTKVLGIDFPESFEIYDNHSSNNLGECIGKEPLKANHRANYIVVLKENNKNYEWASQSKINKLGYLEFNPVYQSIGCTIDGVFYEWELFGHDAEDFLVTFKPKDKDAEELSASFRRMDNGIVSSTINVEGIYPFPQLSSTIDTVESKDPVINYCRTYPIDDYYSCYSQMLANGRFDYKIPESLRDEDVIKRVIGVFEGPILRLIGDLKLTDQSFRIQLEKQKVINECFSKKRIAKDKKDKTIIAAKQEYLGEVERAEIAKEQLLEELNRMEAQYKSQRRLTQEQK